MKKLMVFVHTLSVSLLAFGEGRVLWDNPNRPVVLGDTGHILTLDAPWANLPVPVPYDSDLQLPSGKLLVAGLFAGTTSGSETLIATTPISAGLGPADGLWAPLEINLPSGFSAGVTTFFDVYVWDSAFASPSLASAVGSYEGSSGEFTSIPGTSSYKSLSSAASGSTWSETPIIVTVPEPKTVSLAIFGIATVAMVFRRDCILKGEPFGSA